MLKILRKERLALSIGLFIFLITVLAFAEGEKVLMMATTTSTDNTGLLDYLSPKFKEATGIELRWIATGTGNALKLGENCDVDVLMVHAPDEEGKFVAAGLGIDRREIMYNDFVLIGPAADPGGIRGKSVKDSLRLLKARQITFASRGDSSGTHEKEISLWKAAGLQVPDKESWYFQTGQGMLATINITAERNGYTLTDRGTFFKYEENMKGNPALKTLVEGEQDLLNQYSVIAVNPARCPKVKNDLANEFIRWITGEDAQQLVKDFKLSGKSLFTPNAKR